MSTCASVGAAPPTALNEGISHIIQKAPNPNLALLAMSGRASIGVGQKNVSSHKSQQLERWSDQSFI